MRGLDAFRKVTPKGGASKIGGGDVKRLRAEIAATLSGADADALDALAPKNATYECVKMSNRVIVYLIDGQPLFFDASGGRWEMFPTVYALWALRGKTGLARLRTHSLVSPKVLGGANLMLPGVVLEGDETWEANALVEIGIVDNDDAFAIGVAACSSEEAKSGGMKGIGVELAHTYGDVVWAMGDKSVPSKSFSLRRIYPNGEEAPAETSLVSEESSAVESTMENLSLEGANEADANEADEETFDVSTPAKMDAMFERCFALGANKLTDAELPIRCEAFYANFLLPSRPSGVTLDLKHSSFKKQTKLFNVMEKKVGLIKTKLVHKIENIVSIDRAHALLAKYASASEESKDSGESKAAVDVPLSAASIDISKRYRASTMYRPIFGEQAKQNKDRLYTKAEAFSALGEYVKKNKLGDGGKDSEVQLDTLLGKELFAKKEEWYGTDSFYPFNDLYERLIGKLQPHTIVRSTCDGETKEYVKKGGIKPIVIKAEDRGRRKYITRISGLETYCISPDDFAAIAKKEFSASVSIDDLPGKQEHGKELSIQGHVVIQLADLLRTKMGVPAKFIDAQN